MIWKQLQLRVTAHFHPNSFEFQLPSFGSLGQPDWSLPLGYRPILIYQRSKHGTGSQKGFIAGRRYRGTFALDMHTKDWIFFQVGKCEQKNALQWFVDEYRSSQAANVPTISLSISSHPYSNIRTSAFYTNVRKDTLHKSFGRETNKSISSLDCFSL